MCHGPLKYCPSHTHFTVLYKEDPTLLLLSKSHTYTRVYTYTCTYLYTRFSLSPIPPLPSPPHPPLPPSSSFSYFIYFSTHRPLSYTFQDYILCHDLPVMPNGSLPTTPTLLLSIVLRSLNSTPISPLVSG